jgi:hypothetical protein
VESQSGDQEGEKKKHRKRRKQLVSMVIESYLLFTLLNKPPVA